MAQKWKFSKFSLSVQHLKPIWIFKGTMVRKFSASNFRKYAQSLPSENTYYKTFEVVNDDYVEIVAEGTK